ncbi:unnamed protein product [Boreogadus saida]
MANSSTQVSMQTRPTVERLERIQGLLLSCHLGASLTVQTWLRLLGMLTAASAITPLGLLYLRPLQRWFNCLHMDPRLHRLVMIKEQCKEVDVKHLGGVSHQPPPRRDQVTGIPEGSPETMDMVSSSDIQEQYLQYLFDAGRAASTLKVYLTAISFNDGHIGGRPVGAHYWNNTSGVGSSNTSGVGSSNTSGVGSSNTSGGGSSNTGGGGSSNTSGGGSSNTGGGGSSNTGGGGSSNTSAGSVESTGQPAQVRPDANQPILLWQRHDPSL